MLLHEPCLFIRSAKFHTGIQLTRTVLIGPSEKDLYGATLLSLTPSAPQLCNQSTTWCAQPCLHD